LVEAARAVFVVKQEPAGEPAVLRCQGIKGAEAGLPAQPVFLVQVAVVVVPVWFLKMAHS
jgi:hypothetical protein